MTFLEAKNKIARNRGWGSWRGMCENYLLAPNGFAMIMEQVGMAAELYAEAKVKEFSSKQDAIGWVAFNDEMPQTGQVIIWSSPEENIGKMCYYHPHIDSRIDKEKDKWLAVPPCK